MALVLWTKDADHAMEYALESEWPKPDEVQAVAE